MHLGDRRARGRPRGPRVAIERALAADSLPIQRERKGRNVVDDLRPSVLALSCPVPTWTAPCSSRSSAPGHAASDRPSSPRPWAWSSGLPVEPVNGSSATAPAGSPSGGPLRVPPSSGSAPREKYEKGSSPCPTRAPGRRRPSPSARRRPRIHRSRRRMPPMGSTRPTPEVTAERRPGSTPVAPATRGRRHRGWGRRRRSGDAGAEDTGAGAAPEPASPNRPSAAPATPPERAPWRRAASATTSDDPDDDAGRGRRRRGRRRRGRGPRRRHGPAPGRRAQAPRRATPDR